MKIISEISEMQRYSREQRCEGKKIAVVPTMGYLHEGHLSLIDKARDAADVVIVTNFVNPTQFAPHEDLDSYPRDFDNDCRLCEERGADIVFAPAAEEMFMPGRSTWVVEEKFSKGLCSLTRPTFFRGVCTVVAKLFNITLPDYAVFGQKDAQQALIIRRMVRDLNFPLEIIVAPLIREPDGLAMSSRNRYLSEDEHRRALAISRSLFQAEKMLQKKGIADLGEVLSTIVDNIIEAGGKVDYVEALDSETLEEPTEDAAAVLIACAAVFGKARLLDNIVVKID
ncbi:pantoate--beta-alanine ligase [Lentisphaerota bacterium ZTH]|nr:pantoate--beta-alanine ligase [Lentisphaerota bacterium]WET05869.1 pantoate--beta-alanine ligase [Lentisphaerota bacterium ZTH]